MDSIALYVSVSAFALLILHYFIGRRRFKLPPSLPRGLPFIGHLHLFGKVPHVSLYALAQKYGPLLSFRLAMVPAVLISDARTVRDAFKNNDVIFSGRPYFLYGEYVGYNCKDILHMPYGEKWREMRKICAVELFTTRRISSYSWVRVKELSHVFDVLLRSGDRALNMRDIFTTFTFNFMTQICITKRFFGNADSEDDKEAKEFKEISQELLHLVQKFHVTECMPGSMRWLGKLVDSSIPLFKKLHAKQDKWLNNLISEHKAKPRECKDFMDILLEQFKSEGAEGEERVKALTMDMLVAGTDTSAMTSEWALAELMHNPEALKKARDELEAVVGRHRMVEESDFPKLEYLNAIIKETLRLHSPVPLILRMSGQDCKIAGYDIPKGTTLMLNVYAIGRDPEAWENPFAFMPERFIGSPIELRGQDFELIPFGAGRRVCPGLPLGMRTIQHILSNLIHGFEWSFEPGKETEQSLEAVYETVQLLKNPLHVIATPRLPLDAYHVKGI